MKIKEGIYLKSTITGKKYPISRLKEWSEKKEPLEVVIKNIEQAKIKNGNYLWEKFSDFLPFENINPDLSLGEGNTPILKGSKNLKTYCNLENIYMKNESQNPTWSFKDRGSLACVWMAKAMKENMTATISTGNMGNSIAAYGAKSDLKTVVFLPEFTPEEKVAAIGIHGAEIYKVKSPDYSKMKKKILDYASDLGIRVVSGNGPIRVEGYKLTAFEIYEQFSGNIPEYIAVPTSACGHIRGLFKGFRELKKAGYLNKLPKMIIVQAENNSPIVNAIKQNKKEIIEEENVNTIAEAITSGSPYGGKEIIKKANKYNWLAENVSEDEIIEAQKLLAKDGLFVEPASATTLTAVKKLRNKNLLQKGDDVMLVLTGSGLKDFDIIKDYKFNINDVNINSIEEWFDRNG
ncbi:MAG: threonine synthase [Bacillota bacterium]